MASSSDFRKLEVKQYPRLPGRRTAESRYWRKFKFPVLVKEYGAVTNIDFSPVRPYDFAVTSSMRVRGHFIFFLSSPPCLSSFLCR